MTKKLFALFATLPVASFGAAGIALADNVTVVNHNGAYVKNHVSSSADTGGNTAGGSTGGNGGNAGGVLNQGTGNNADDNVTGNGGNGGNAGIGGTIYTGNAMSGVLVDNRVNRNVTEISSCGCDEEQTHGGDTRVVNRNHAKVKNHADSYAGSGDNTAHGSVGGKGGNGGYIKNIGEDNDADDNMGGKGGNGGAGSDGGLVQSGDAGSVSNVLNVINRNITRILR